MRLFSFSADFATHIMEKQLAQWYGIVEFKDGVRRVDPVSIKFCDEENADLCALVKHNEALRKGEVNAES